MNNRIEERQNIPRSEFDHLYRIEKFMASMTDLDELLSVIMRETTLATDAASCSIALYDEEAHELQFSVARGEEEERDFERKLKQIRIPMGAGVVGWCASNRRIANIKDTLQDPRFDSETDKKTGFSTESILAVPMIRQDRLIGVVEAVNKNNDEGFSDHDEQVLTVLAAQAALVIENARLLSDNLQKTRFSALGQGIAGAAHCIKNIVNGIAGGNFILEIGFKKQNMEQVEQGWEILKRNTEVMKDLVLDMLSYSGPSKLEYEEANINTICSDLVELLVNGAKEIKVEIKTDFDPLLKPTVVDPKGIYRCVLNLLTNAVDACSENSGVICIHTRREPDRFKIIVDDTGHGVSEEHRSELFKVFFSTKGSKGTGLGLAITHKIVHEHGGTIEVESVIDKGTTFTISLPYK
ncbi:MAG: GAF domain-containing sensor histidine kinase [Spirochaetales bacterium]|jgi:signal transduction histidine kinase|nr:GAF domain-containing sensor histidine kinase [Spirochaetales bacterium]